MLKLSGKQASILQVAVIVILGLLIYAPCAGGKFIWDDHGLIKDNTAIKDWSSLPRILKADFGFGSSAHSNYYRPIQTVIQMAGYACWQDNPLGYHLISILAHILAAVLFYFLLCRIFQDQTFSCAASLLFLSCPVNTEAVCYISGLSDPLAMVFLLTCLIFYLKHLVEKDLAPYLLALLSFGLALLSKENAVVLPPLILLYHYAFRKKIPVRKVIPFFCILSGYALIRMAILSNSGRLALSGLDLWQRVPIFFAGFLQYGQLLLLPVGLHMEYPHEAPSLTDLRVIGGAVSVFLLITLALLKRKTHPGFFFASGWFFIAFLPVSNIYPISYALIMEHYLYLPALGFFIIVAKIFCYPGKRKTTVFILRLAMITLIIFYAYLTFKQAGYWKDPVAFYKRTLQYAPGSWRFYNELGLEYAAGGSSPEAEKAYQEAIRINPDALGVYANLAGLYQKTADQKKLLATEKLADQVKVKLLTQHLEMAIGFKAAESYAQAAVELKEALGLSPGNLIIAQDLASLYVLMGRYKDAAGLFTEILSAKPDFALAYNNLAVAYYYLKQYDLAVSNCDKALVLGCQVAPGFIKLLKPHRK